MTDEADPDLLRRMEDAVRNLPMLQREIFLAHRLDDMPYEEIASRTGLSSGRSSATWPKPYTRSSSSSTAAASTGGSAGSERGRIAAGERTSHSPAALARRRLTA